MSKIVAFQVVPPNPERDTLETLWVLNEDGRLYVTCLDDEDKAKLVPDLYGNVWKEINNP